MNNSQPVSRRRYARAKRGVNRDTAFDRWWKLKGRATAEMVRSRIFRTEDDKLKQLVEYGYIWGWMDRRDRDAKLRRKR